MEPDPSKAPEPQPAPPQPAQPPVPADAPIDAPTDTPDRKAELRARLFSSEANDVEIPIPPKPPEPKAENDAPLLMYVAFGFFVLGFGCLIASRVVPYEGLGLNPFEVLAIVGLTAAGVTTLWWLTKAFNLRFHFIRRTKSDVVRGTQHLP